MTTQTKCPRCGGQDGAHYAACLLQNVVQRWLGPEYPLFPPPRPTVVATHAHTEAIEDLRRRITGLARDMDGLRQEVVEAVTPLIAEVRRDVDHLTDAVTRPFPTLPQSEDWTPEKAGQFEDAVTAGLEAAVNVPKPEKVIEAENSGKPPAPAPEPPHLPEARQKATALVEQNAREVAKILVGLLEDHTVTDPDGWVAAPELLRLVQAIRPETIAREAGIAMRILGYTEKKQLPMARPLPGDGARPMHYRGLRWKGNTIAEPPSEPPLDEQMAQRRAAEEAAKKQLPKTEYAEPYRYEGPKPGKELTPELRALLEPLWTQPGWSYAPRNPNGGGKPRVISPEGTQYILPNTPSDVRGIRNTRAALRRLGGQV